MRELGDQMTKIIYIGGYGHSGSTMLEYLLAGSPAVLACGEIVTCIRQQARKRRTCTCGESVTNCRVWTFFYLSADTITWSHARLVKALLQRFGGQYGAIIDSSKTAWGSLGLPFQLERGYKSNFTLVHLVREPAAVCWSVLKVKSRR